MFKLASIVRKAEKDPFSTEYLSNGLKVHAIKSMSITVIAQVMKLLLQLISITTLARLLSPTDFGLVAMVTVFTGLTQALVDGGLSMATVQRKEITHAQVSNLFWINSVVGLSLCLISVMMAPIVAGIYSEPRLTEIMLVLSITFLMGGLSVQHDALLRRQMRFKAIAVIDIISAVLSIGAGITCAVNGLGYWSLVIMSVTNTAVQMCMRWWSLSWRPSLLSFGSGTKPLLSFGINLTGANFVGYFVSNATPFFIGYLGGAQVLGIFNRAQTLTSIPSSQLLPPVTKVLQPTLSRVADDPEKLRRAIIGFMRKIALLTIFVTINMVVMADWIVAILLGDAWKESVQVFRFLSLFTVVTPITTFTAVTLVAVGEARALLYWRCITLVILATSLFVGSLWDVPGVIAAFALSGFFVRMPLFLYYGSRFLPVSFRDYMVELAPVFSVAIVTTLLLVGFRQLISIDNPIIGLTTCFIAAFTIYLLLCLSLRPLRMEIVESQKLLRLVWNKT